MTRYYTEGKVKSDFLEPGVAITGSLTDVNGVLSGFSSNNYAYSPSSISNASVFDIKIKATLPSSPGGQRIFMVGNTKHNIADNDSFDLMAAVNQAGTEMYFKCMEPNIGTFEITPNATYYIRVVSDGTIITSYKSTTGFSNMDTVGTTSFSHAINGNLYLGWNGVSGGKEPFQGSIDLTECSVSIDGDLWWIGAGQAPLSNNYRRVYYKYIDVQSWVQPVLTSNGSDPTMTVSASSYYSSSDAPWMAFDNSASTAWVTASMTPQGSLKVHFKNRMRISAIEVTGYRNQYSYCKTVTIYKDEDNTDLVGEQKTFYTSSGTSVDATQTWTFNTPVDTDFLSFYSVGGTSDWTGIAEIRITASELIMGAGTSSDYDYYVDIPVPLKTEHEIVKSFGPKTRNYYKYKEVAPGYREIKYISGCQLDTGVQCTTTTSFEYKVIPMISHNWTYVIQNSGSSAGTWYISGAENATKFSIHFGSSVYEGTSTIELGKTYVISSDFSTYRKRGYVDGVQEMYIQDSTNANWGNTFLLDTSRFSNIYLKFFDSSMNCIYDIVACERASDNTLGWYDKISGTFSAPTSGTAVSGGYEVLPGTENDYDYYEDDVSSLQDWTQPTLDSNGTVGGEGYACESSSQEGSLYPWKAFDKDSSTRWSPSSSSVPQWLTFYSPVYLKVESVKLDFYQQGEAYSAGEVQGSNDNSSWDTLVSFSSNSSQTITLQVETNKLYKYIRFYGTQRYGGGYGKVAEMTITAKQSNQSTIATSSYKIAKITTLGDWIQPVLSSNGTLGGTSYACTASSYEGSFYPWQAFDGDASSTRWGPSGSPSSSNPCWIEFYSPHALKISSVNITFYNSSEVFTNGELLGSFDGVNWVELGSYSGNSSTSLSFNVVDRELYKYIKLTAKGSIGGWGKITNFAITAEALTSTAYKMVKLYL